VISILALTFNNFSCRDRPEWKSLSILGQAFHPVIRSVDSFLHLSIKSSFIAPNLIANNAYSQQATILIEHLRHTTVHIKQLSEAKLRYKYML